MRYRLLAHVLAGALLQQMRLDVNNHIFAIGKTSSLVGTTLGRILHQGPSAVGPTPVPNFLRPAALILIDRTVDMATATSNDPDSLLQKIRSVVPNWGKPDGGGGGGSSNAALRQAHNHDAGVNPPALFPPLDR